MNDIKTSERPATISKVFMRAGIGFQVNTVFNESGIFTPKTSRHLLKEDARANGARNTHEIGKLLTITSHGTAETYKDAWHRFSKWGKTNLGLKHIESANKDAIRGYLLSRISKGVLWATFQKEASALQKLEVALNRFAEKRGTGNEYDFSQTIKDVSKLASEHCERGRFYTRAYIDPEKVIEGLSRPVDRIVASIQFEGGARFSETYLKSDQLRGINADGKGVIHLARYNTKGGRERDIFVSRRTYDQLESHLKTSNVLKVPRSTYLNHLKKSAISASQVYTGSHGLRWNFAQNRMAKLQENGHTYEHSMSIVSHEMGHSRADNTERYLK